MPAVPGQSSTRHFDRARPPRRFVESADGLSISGLSVRDLVAEHGSPLHIVDMADLDRNAEAALAPYRDGERGADVYSSYKTNPIPGVLGRLHDAGIGAEAISAYELWLALELGVAPQRIIYNGPAKSAESLRTSAQLGVELVNANSLGDLRQMIAAATSVGSIMRVGIRISLPHMWGGQFGLPFDSADVAVATREATNSPHVELVGLHFHSGFGLQSAASVTMHMQAVLAFCDALRNDTGFHPQVIDLGGSLTVPTVISHARPSRLSRLTNRIRRRPEPPALESADITTIAEASSLVWELAEGHYRVHGLPTPRLVLEPGRSLTGDTQFMLTTALDVEDSGSGAEAIRTVILDAGVELAEPMRGGGHDIMNTTRPDATPRRHRLVGPRTDDSDVLVSDMELPGVERGDILAVLDTGAYFVPFSTASTFPRPAILALEDGVVSTLRAREGVERFSALDPD